MSNAAVGKAIDEIAKLQKHQDEFEAKANAIEKQIKEKKEKLLGRLKKSKLDGATGALGRAVVDEEDVPNVEDFQKLCAYAAKTKGWDLLQKRVSKEAWRARIADGKKVPGIKIFHRVALRVVLIKTKRK